MFKHGCVLLLVALGSACSSGSSGFPIAPSTPVIPTPSPTPPLTPSSPSIATLTVSSFTVTRSAFQPYLDKTYYDAKLRLTETGGQSGATLSSVAVSVSGVGTDTCFRPFKRIGPGESWDLDSTVDYCAPEVIIPGTRGTEGVSVTVTLSFRDDNGGRDSVTVTTETK